MAPLGDFAENLSDIRFKMRQAGPLTEIAVNNQARFDPWACLFEWLTNFSVVIKQHPGELLRFRTHGTGTSKFAYCNRNSCCTSRSITVSLTCDSGRSLSALTVALRASMANSYARFDSAEPSVFSTARFAKSRSGSRKTRFGFFCC